jgi:putative two-component system response regulator
LREKPRILIIDDELGPREALRMILRDNYHVETAANGNEALAFLYDTEFDMVILDIRMPDINGIELLGKVKEVAPETEVALITAYASVDTATDALRLGALDYIIKPFSSSSILEVVEKGLERRSSLLNISYKLEELQLLNKSLDDQVKKAYKNIQTHYEETVRSLVAAIDAKDSYTKGHQERMSKFAVLLGREMKIPSKKLRLIEQASLLHDIGKIGVPEHILRKKGPLSKEEFESIKQHPVIGAKIISPVRFLKEVVPLVLHHHERYDGKGYPEGLKGEQIPLETRIITIADAIDAMLSQRPYAPPRPVHEVKLELRQKAGSQFDPLLVEMILEKNLLVRHCQYLKQAIFCKQN